LHVYRTKSLKHDNPHLQSAAKRKLKKIRKFSNAFLTKQNQKENESVLAKTPEESVCSNDALNLSMALTPSSNQ
jgi:Holliday junction resolvase-like predicted endonuclease